MKPEDLIDQIEKRLSTVHITPKTENIGIVEMVGDGIIQVNGLSRAGFGEEVEFSNGSKGLAFNLGEDLTSIILLSSDATLIREGDTVKTTGKILGITGSYELMGRVIDPLQNPLDAKGLTLKGPLYHLEKIAPGVIDRQPVDTPIKTGIKAIDAMTPIGRGQRELIIGDRNTGKTAIAIDTIETNTPTLSVFLILY